MSRKRRGPPVPRTCCICDRPIEEVGCYRVVCGFGGGEVIWCCRPCEPEMLRLLWEEGIDVPAGEAPEGVIWRPDDPITRAVKAVSRAERGQP